jgi:hypothetical protein
MYLFQNMSTNLIYVLLSFFILIFLCFFFFHQYEFIHFLFVCSFRSVLHSNHRLHIFTSNKFRSFYYLTIHFVRSFGRSFNHSNRCVHFPFIVITQFPWRSISDCEYPVATVLQLGFDLLGLQSWAKQHCGNPSL